MEVLLKAIGLAFTWEYIFSFHVLLMIIVGYVVGWFLTRFNSFTFIVIMFFLMNLINYSSWEEVWNNNVNFLAFTIWQNICFLLGVIIHKLFNLPLFVTFKKRQS